MSQYQIFVVVSNYIPHIVNQYNNDLLTKIHDYMEIKYVVFAFNIGSALGSNGLGDLSIIVVGILFLLIFILRSNNFFFQSWILPDMNSNIISLIPKVHGVDDIKDCRPIVITKFRFKVISKILTDRISIVCTRVI